MNLPFATELFTTLQLLWPPKGKVILYSPNVHSKNDTIVLYQAYKESIANYAVSHQTFKNCPDFVTTRMTWLKPNFLWIMYRSGWATKSNQEKILALTVKREDFNDILRASVSTSKKDTGIEKAEINVRLQWDPDHDPFGNKVERRAIQIGIRGNALQKFLSHQIMNICDITEFVQEQRNNANADRLNLLRIPAEIIYTIDDESLRNHIKLD